MKTDSCSQGMQHLMQQGLELMADEATGAEIDGTTEAFKRDHPGADDGQGDLLAGTPEEALAAAVGGDGDAE